MMDRTSRIHLVKPPSPSNARLKVHHVVPDLVQTSFISPMLKILQILCLTCSSAFSEVLTQTPKIQPEVPCCGL